MVKGDFEKVVYEHLLVEDIRTDERGWSRGWSLYLSVVSFKRDTQEDVTVILCVLLQMLLKRCSTLLSSVSVTQIVL